MKDLYPIYVGKPTSKSVLLRKVTWMMCHWRNLKIYFSPNFKSYRYWFWNIQLFIIGTRKANGSVHFRLLNWSLEIGW